MGGWSLRKLADDYWVFFLFHSRRAWSSQLNQAHRLPSAATVQQKGGGRLSSPPPPPLPRSYFLQRLRLRPLRWMRSGPMTSPPGQTTSTASLQQQVWCQASSCFTPLCRPTGFNGGWGGSTNCSPPSAASRCCSCSSRCTWCSTGPTTCRPQLWAALLSTLPLMPPPYAASWSWCWWLTSWLWIHRPMPCWENPGFAPPWWSRLQRWFLGCWQDFENSTPLTVSKVKCLFPTRARNFSWQYWFLIFYSLDFWYGAWCTRGKQRAAFSPVLKKGQFTWQWPCWRSSASSFTAWYWATWHSRRFWPLLSWPWWAWPSLCCTWAAAAAYSLCFSSTGRAGRASTPCLGSSITAVKTQGALNPTGTS